MCNAKTEGAGGKEKNKKTDLCYVEVCLISSSARNAGCRSDPRSQTKAASHTHNTTLARPHPTRHEGTVGQIYPFLVIRSTQSPAILPPNGLVQQAYNQILFCKLAAATVIMVKYIRPPRFSANIFR